MAIDALCGQLVLGGFRGTSLPAHYARALEQSRRCGAVLFKSNVEGGPLQVAALAREVHARAPQPLLAIDQEGGRVARLRAPALAVPPMRTVASWGDPIFAESLARAVGAELAALGITLNFAPVVDVDTHQDNPIIGDRAFGATAEVCAAFGASWIRGLQIAGVLATAKHFPGHGDTSSDSHLELPVVTQSRERMGAVELAPFHAAVRAGVAAMMTAHVVYTAFDAERPGTLSPAICTTLRREIGFAGVLLTDDLEMKAIADRGSIEDAAVEAIAAGCDVALICHDFEAQERALDALAREAERSQAFRTRCLEATARVHRTRALARVRPQDDTTVLRAVGGAASRAIEAEVARRSLR
jgi:beta-N-acetylhexosaminidase